MDAVTLDRPARGDFSLRGLTEWIVYYPFRSLLYKSSSMQSKYHIVFDDKRTTISVDTILSELLAIKLGYAPDDDDAHSAVREWLQETLVSHLGDDSGPKSASQFARKYLIEQIADKKLSSKRSSWLYGE